MLDHMATLFLVFWGNSLTVFHNGCINLHSYQQCWRIPVYLHHPHHLSFVEFVTRAMVQTFFFMLIVTLMHIFVVCMYVSSQQFLIFSICSTHPPSDLEYSLYFFKEKLSSISLFSFVHLYKDLECLFFIYLVSPPHTFHCQFLCATLRIDFHGQIF